MTDPISFASTTSRLDLPLLFAGQAQKEVTVNEALVSIDLLLHGAVEGVLAVPPASPAIGQCWIIGTSPQGEWAGHSGDVAGWTEGGWRFIPPAPGMRLYDRAAAAFRLFNGQWTIVSAPAAPQGGGTIDVEARAALAILFTRLSQAGIFPGS